MKQNNLIFFNVFPQSHNAGATSIESLPTRKKKQEIECDLVKKSTIYKEEEIKGKVMMSCLR